MKLDVCMPTLGLQGDATEQSLQHLPCPYRLIKSEAPGWSNALNECLRQREPGADVLIIDDDAQLLPETFQNMEDWYPKADIFGFKLLYPEGGLQHDGGWTAWHPQEGAYAGHIMGDSDQPSYVAYVTASICLIKAALLERQPEFKVWPGAHWEDVAYCVQAQADLGAKVMYVPNPGVHGETLTKRHDPTFNFKFAINRLMLSLELGPQVQQVAHGFQFKKRRVVR